MGEKTRSETLGHFVRVPSSEEKPWGGFISFAWRQGFAAKLVLELCDPPASFSESWDRCWLASEEAFLLSPHLTRSW